MDRYWILTLKDDYGGHKIKIAPDKVQHINSLMDENRPVKTPIGTYQRHQILSFNRWAAPVIQPSLAEAAAIAFDDPILNSEGEVQCYWVKQPVTAAQWNKHYSHFAAYQKLSVQGDKVMVAFRMPVHQYHRGVEKCTDIEAQACAKRATLG